MPRNTNYTKPIATVKGQHFHDAYSKWITSHSIKCYSEAQITAAESQLDTWRWDIRERRVKTERYE